MNIYCIRLSLLTTIFIKIKQEIDRKIIFYYNCIDCGFTKLDDWLRRSNLKYIWNNVSIV